MCIKTDSSTAVNYINNKGGSVVPLLEQTRNIWFWCAERNIFISSVHIPGKENFAPDNLSRFFNDTSEWKLKESVFLRIVKQFFQLDLDLFASRISAQLQHYVSWFPDPEAQATNAFSFSWHDLTPPFSQIPAVLQKIEDDRVRKAIIIVPMWTTQLWYPKLLELFIDFPVRLPQCSDLLTLVHSGVKHQMNKRKLFLIACLIC